jgi:hypothetical protein
MKSEYDVSLINRDNSKELEGMPLFYDFIYFNKMMETKMENECCFISKENKGYISFERPPYPISLIIDYNKIEL